MSISSATSANEQHIAREHRFATAKVVVGVSFLLVLGYLGYQGRQQAMLEARLEEMAPIRNQIQEALDEDEPSTRRLLARFQEVSIDTDWPPSNPQLSSLAGSLGTLIARFESDYSQTRLPELEGLQLRLSQATLANAEHRFTDALAAITAKHEPAPQSGLKVLDNVRASLVRGDSLYGLHRWLEALDCYQRVLALQPNRTAILARLGECQVALGKRDEALATSLVLGKRHDGVGNACLVQGKPEAAIVHYQSALNLQTWLLGQERDPERQRALATTLHNLGCAFLVQEQPALAAPHFQKALELENPLLEQAKGDDLNRDVAINHFHLANAFLGQQNVGTAISNFDKAISIQTQLLAQARDSDLTRELAMSHNNRGVALRVEGKVEPAISAFQRAVEMLTPATSAPRQSALTIDPGGDFQVRLDFAVEFTEQRLEISSHARSPKGTEPTEIPAALAIALRNLAYACLAQGNPATAIENFKLAAAACAEMGDYVEAVKSQQKALELATDNAKPELLSRLELYKAGKPYQGQP